MPRVLLIDDDSAGLDLRRLILQREGYQVSCAVDPRQARAAFADHSPDLIILDMRLPQPEDALLLIRDFRAQSPQVKIVVLCGHTPDIEERPEARLVDQILSKPIRTEKLLAALRSVS